MTSRHRSSRFGAAGLALIAAAWREVAHAHGPDEGAHSPATVWYLGVALTVVVVVVALLQARRGGEYVRRVR